MSTKRAPPYCWPLARAHCRPRPRRLETGGATRRQRQPRAACGPGRHWLVALRTATPGQMEQRRRRPNAGARRNGRHRRHRRRARAASHSGPHMPRSPRAGPPCRPRAGTRPSSAAASCMRASCMRALPRAAQFPTLQRVLPPEKRTRFALASFLCAPQSMQSTRAAARGARRNRRSAHTIGPRLAGLAVGLSGGANFIWPHVTGNRTPPPPGTSGPVRGPAPIAGGGRRSP